MSLLTDSEAASAKINLFLHVHGRRPDGYHELTTWFAFVDVCDQLTVTQAHDLTLQVTGSHAAGLTGDGADNLVLRAARALQAEAGAVPPGAALILHKALPVAAGLGGGSADAAATLRLLNRFWGLELPFSRLQAIAAQLGADVPACLTGQSHIAGGRGDEWLADAPLPPRAVLLVNPGKPLSTADVFRQLGAQPLAPGWQPGQVAPVSLSGLGKTRNDLTMPAETLMPEIASLKARLEVMPGCELARLSGSGPTLFALFSGDDACAAAADVLAPDSSLWLATGRLIIPAHKNESE